MIHDFANRMSTPEVIEKELKMKPEEFDKQFLPWLEAQTKKTVDGFDDWAKRVKGLNESAKNKDWDTLIKEGNAIRDNRYTSTAQYCIPQVDDGADAFRVYC